MKGKPRTHIVESVAQASRQELLEGLAQRRDVVGDAGTKKLAGGVWRLTIKLREGVAPATFARPTRRSHARPARNAVEDVHG